jgi:hypothetical protein
MNPKATRVFSIGLLALLCLVLPGSLRADTIYTYSGEPYSPIAPSFCNGTYTPVCTELAITGSFTTATALGDNLVVDTITPKSFSFTDGGGATLTSSSTLAISTIWVSTNASGNIVAWDVSLATNAADCTSAGVSFECIGSYFNSGYGAGGDFSAYDVVGGPYGAGQNSATPGTWAITSTLASPTPEPPSYLLFGTALVSLLGWGIQRRQRTQPHITAAGENPLPESRGAN